MAFQSTKSCQRCTGQICFPLTSNTGALGPSLNCFICLSFSRNVFMYLCLGRVFTCQSLFHSDHSQNTTSSQRTSLITQSKVSTLTSPSHFCPAVLIAVISVKYRQAWPSCSTLQFSACSENSALFSE